MFKLEVIIIVSIWIIPVIESQKYLDCTFDQGDVPCRLNPVDTSPELQTISSIPIDNPLTANVLPLSDVTSITRPTIGNNLPCQIPYKHNNSSENIYFCAQMESSSNLSSCITTDFTNQECMLGQYVMAQLDTKENFTYYIEVPGTTGPSCLTLYYYITRPNVGQIVVWCTDIVGGTTEQIGIISSVPYNGWHQAHFTFEPRVMNYYIHFDLVRLEHADQIIFIAFDEIKIVIGHCDGDIVETTTKVDQTSQTTTQEVVVTTSTAVSTQETMPPSTETSSTSTISTPVETTESFSSQTWFETTVPTTITPIVTTEQPFHAIFQCDFTTSCFGNDAFRITNGNEFNPTNLSNSSEPPEAPTSDVTSITNPTSNNEVCQLPYKPKHDDSNETTTWDMWFCYNEECPTKSGEKGACVVDQYGLISLVPSENAKIVIDSLTPNVSPRDVSGDQCLRFYYYFTVYDGADWGQQIELTIRYNNGSVQASIGTLTIDDMRENKWNIATIPFQRESSNDTLQIVFQVLLDNREENATTNRTINFGMDNIELYNYNCSYVNEQLATTTVSTQSTTITTTEPKATPPNKKEPDLGLILGLSLGIGGIFIIIITGFLIHKCKVKGRARKKSAYEYDKYFPLESPLHKRNNK
ncbi:hypothetical protein I4U23_020413 [Adineta vaga]|nr:hypothetical protein I4U23_020413 [Adineta vaga]